MERSVEAGTALLSLVVALGGLSPTPLAAQSTPADATRKQWTGAAVPAIAVADVARDLGVFATDSLRIRPTPSAGLTAAAAYVAAEFRRLGLSTELQAYPIPGQQRVDLKAAGLSLVTRVTRNGKPILAEEGRENGWPSRRETPLSFRTDLYFAPAVGRQQVKPRQLTAGSLVGAFGEAVALLAGPYTAARVGQLSATLRDRVVLYVPPADGDTAIQRSVIAALYATARGVIVAGTSDSARFAAEQSRAPEAEFVDDYMRSGPSDQNPWAVVARGSRLAGVLASEGEELERLRASATPVLRPLAFRVVLGARGEPITDGVVHAPNVIGTLPGSDPAVRDQCLVIVAPLDSRDGDGSPGMPPERVDADADDGASAVAGLLALARAFTQPGQPLRRPIVLLAASGGTHNEFWGAQYFVKKKVGFTGVCEPQKSVALALDRLGAWPGDSAMVAGLRDVEVKPPLTWIRGNHPDLDLRLVDGGAAIEPIADQFAFVRQAIPSLYFHAADDARSTAADAEQVVRGARLVFALAQALANADRHARWSTEGRRQLRTVLDP